MYRGFQKEAVGECIRILLGEDFLVEVSISVRPDRMVYPRQIRMLRWIDLLLRGQSQMVERFERDPMWPLLVGRVFLGVMALCEGYGHDKRDEVIPEIQRVFLGVMALCEGWRPDKRDSVIPERVSTDGRKGCQ